MMSKAFSVQRAEALLAGAGPPSGGRSRAPPSPRLASVRKLSSNAAAEAAVWRSPVALPTSPSKSSGTTLKVAPARARHRWRRAARRLCGWRRGLAEGRPLRSPRRRTPRGRRRGSRRRDRRPRPRRSSCIHRPEEPRRARARRGRTHRHHGCTAISSTACSRTANRPARRRPPSAPAPRSPGARAGDSLSRPGNQMLEIPPSASFTVDPRPPIVQLDALTGCGVGSARARPSTKTASARWMASFLAQESTLPPHARSGAVLLFRGSAAADTDELIAACRRRACDPRSALPAEARLPATRDGQADLIRRSAAKHRLSPAAPHGAYARAGVDRRAPPARRAHLLPAPRSHQAAVGDVARAGLSDGASRSSPRPTTRWWTASPASTSPPCSSTWGRCRPRSSRGPAVGAGA